MKKIISILITLIFTFSFASCSVSGTDDTSATGETVSAEAEQSAVDATDVSEEPTPEMVQYQSAYGAIPYSAAYQDDYIITEKEDDGALTVEFNTETDGQKYHLFSLIMTDEENEWAVTDNEGNKHYVTVEMNDIDTDNLTQEQQDKLFAMQEGVNDILDYLQP